MLFKALVTIGLMTVLGVSVSTAQQMAPQNQQQPQTDISDDKLEQFVEVLGEVSTIQQGMQQKMISVVEEEGLDVNKFNQIAQQQQNPNAEGPAVTDEEKAAFDRAMQSVQTMQMDMQQKMQAKVEESNMNMDEFNSLMTAYQQDPELQQKVNAMMEQR